MSQKSTVWALAAALVLSVAPAAQAHGNHACSCGHGYAPSGYAPAGYAPNGYAPIGYVPSMHAQHPAHPYNGHWHGSTFYGYGSHWGTSLDAMLFAASANGDVHAVKRLLERGANIDARDSEGLRPITWAAQYGRTEVVRYLIDRRAQINPADKYGFTPLMWAAQEGHQGVVDLLLSKGANPWVVNRNGVSAMTLARYSGNWRTASSLENWLAGRYWGPNMPRPGARPATPTRVTVAPAAPVIPAPMVEAARPADPGMLAKAMAVKKIAETGAMFGDEYTAFIKVSTSGGLNMNSLAAMTSPDMETGKLLSAFFANLTRTQDLRAARADLDKAKASLNGNNNARFARYVMDADKALSEAGF